MDTLTRENVVTGVAVVVAILAFYVLGAYTEVGDIVRYGVLILIGVVVPFLLTDYSS